MENKNGQGIFYGVIGVATLVVAIIGATFAYFSASQTAGNGIINGSTNDDVASNLNLSVTRSSFTFSGTAPDVAPASDDLVPAILDATTTTGINRALSAKCVNDGYTGCHVYDIEVSSDAVVTSANLIFDLTTTANDDDNWKYFVYSGTASSATGIAKSATTFVDSTSGAHNMNITGGLSTTAQHFYLVVYLENVDHSQNNDTNDTNATDETGTYSGTVALQAAGGQVKASFAA